MPQKLLAPLEDFEMPSFDNPKSVRRTSVRGEGMSEVYVNIRTTEKASRDTYVHGNLIKHFLVSSLCV